MSLADTIGKAVKLHWNQIETQYQECYVLGGINTDIETQRATF